MPVQTPKSSSPVVPFRGAVSETGDSLVTFRCPRQPRAEGASRRSRACGSCGYQKTPTRPGTAPNTSPRAKSRITVVVDVFAQRPAADRRACPSRRHGHVHVRDDSGVRGAGERAQLGAVDDVDGAADLTGKSDVRSRTADQRNDGIGSRESTAKKNLPGDVGARSVDDEVACERARRSGSRKDESRSSRSRSAHRIREVARSDRSERSRYRPEIGKLIPDQRTRGGAHEDVVGVCGIDCRTGPRPWKA